MGTKFREIDNTSWEKAKSATIEGLKDWVDTAAQIWQR